MLGRKVMEGDAGSQMKAGNMESGASIIQQYEPKPHGILAAAYSPTPKLGSRENSNDSRSGETSTTKLMIGKTSARYASPLALEIEFYETRLPNEDENYSKSPAARHAMGDGSLDPNQTFFGRTFNRKMKMRDTFTKLFPTYDHGKPTNYAPDKIQSKVIHAYPPSNDLGGKMQEIDRTYTHKKDEMKNFHEAMLRI